VSALRHVATIESIGSSMRIEGRKLSDCDVERLLANLENKSFAIHVETAPATLFDYYPDLKAVLAPQRFTVTDPPRG
jgi:hypothetical protein